MNFGQALEELKQGKRIAREGWNGKGMFLWQMDGIAMPVEKLQHPETIVILKEMGKIEVTFLPTIRMFTATGDILTGWLASQSDVFAEDWVVLF